MSYLRTSLRSCAAGCALIASLPSAAANFSPTRFDDPVPNGCVPADCSLREAVIAANATADKDIIFLQSGTYELTQLFSPRAPNAQHLDLNVTSPLHIQGQTNGQTTIRNAVGANDFSDARVFSVHDTQLSMTWLTLRDGYSAGFPGGQGGCLLAVESSLFLFNVRVTECQAEASGGGIFLNRSSATLQSVLIDHNKSLYGGGITSGDSYMTGNEIAIADNSAGSTTTYGAGGGVYVFAYLDGYGVSTIRWRGGSTINNNVASDGGGIEVAQDAHLEISAVITEAPSLNDLLLIEGNIAENDAGGIRAKGRLSGRWLGLRLNEAGRNGGAILAEARLELSDSELAFNEAGRDGGGIQLTSGAADSLIDRVSLTGNHAVQFGGGISTSATDSTLRNVSSYANSAAAGGGFNTWATTHLRHVSSLNDSANSGAGGSLRVGVNHVHLRSSVLASGCRLLHGGIFDLGGNAQMSGQTACTGTIFSRRGLGLSYGYFGGFFEIVGINDQTSPLRNFVSKSHDTLVDIRGWLRSGLADAGAHEYDGAPTR